MEWRIFELRQVADDMHAEHPIFTGNCGIFTESIRRSGRRDCEKAVSRSRRSREPSRRFPERWCRSPERWRRSRNGASFPGTVAQQGFLIRRSRRIKKARTELDGKLIGCFFPPRRG